MPMMAFIGVRISWLMLARKSALMRAASSASARAFCIRSMASNSAEMSSMTHTEPLLRSDGSTAVPVSRTQKSVPSRRMSCCSRRCDSPRQIAAYTGSPPAACAASSGYQTAVRCPTRPPGGQPNISCRRRLPRTSTRSLISAIPEVAVSKIACCSALASRSEALTAANSAVRSATRASSRSRYSASSRCACFCAVTSVSTECSSARSPSWITVTSASTSTSVPSPRTCSHSKRPPPSASARRDISSASTVDGWPSGCSGGEISMGVRPRSRSRLSRRRRSSAARLAAMKRPSSTSTIAWRASSNTMWKRAAPAGERTSIRPGVMCDRLRARFASNGRQASDRRASALLVS